ncbi:MerR family transcriptional regulator [Planococcus kocurii]|uniref:Transcriptional regulator n=1 Tax=Planococcus kocurii TaxID=1374 RepID=A0ABM5WSG9_9BACL|nr:MULTISPECIES: MerR family transcriptional regulator [Planococcus]ALS77229.1 transcriptional regulator [Planococcus kocurii]KAA0956242.1 MerR family transcriptional regulator [Planococcus sp. ANT_H30]
MTEKYLTTGDFSKLCKVNKQTIIYYDQIGLLTPAYRNQKGYRFYSFRQLEVFNVIYLLKELGMSLEEIKSYMEQKSPELFHSLMIEQKEKVRTKKRMLDHLEMMMDVKINLLEEAEEIDFHQVSFLYLSESFLYLSPNITDINDDDFAKVVTQFINTLNEQNLDTGFQIGGMTLHEQVVKGEYTNYSYLYMKQLEQRKSQPFFKIAAGMYAVGYHLGKEDTIHVTYERLFSEIRRNHYEIGDYIMEEYIYDGLVKSGEDHYITKILVQLK